MIKHRADSGGAVKGPCSSENGQKVREGGETEGVGPRTDAKVEGEER